MLKLRAGNDLFFPPPVPLLAIGSPSLAASCQQPEPWHEHLLFMIRKLKSGEYRLYSRKKDAKTGKRRNLGTFSSRAAAQRHERAVEFFKKA